MKKHPLFLDLFAGAGGLTEGFIQAGFKPVAHVEADTAACFTLRTRMARHWLVEHNKEEIYKTYLQGKLTRSELYYNIPVSVINSVMNTEIGEYTMSETFQKIDSLLGARKLDLIIGGPPCQAYSLIGRSRDQNRMQGDRRNYLYRYYALFLKKYKPSYFVFENVTGLLSAKDKNGKLYFDMMRLLFHECGYETEYKTLTAADYGVLQNRKRIILVGKKGKKEGFYPVLKQCIADVLVDEIFRDMPVLNAGKGSSGPCEMKKYTGNWLYRAGIRNDIFPVTWHQARTHTEQDLEIYRIAVDLWNKEKRRLDYNELPEKLITHHNRTSFTDRFKVVAADMPFSHTVVAHIARDGHYYIHPDINQNRSITPREAARLQTFPDDYYFESISGVPSRTPAFRQIGNAVPVLLARKIAEKLKEMW